METTKVLKGFRAKRLLSQDMIADKLDITRQTYNYIENEPLRYDLQTVIKVLEVLDLNQMEIEEFFNALKQDYLSCKEKNEKD